MQRAAAVVMMRSWALGLLGSADAGGVAVVRERGN